MVSKIGVDDLHGGGGQRRAGAAFFNDDGHGDLGVFIGGVGHKHAVGDLGAHLSRAGLGAGGDHAFVKGAGQ